MASAPRDDNRIPSLVGASSSDASVPVVVYADPTTHRLLVDSSGGSGSSATQVVVTSGTVNINTGTIYVKIEDTAGNSITSTGNALDVNLKNAIGGTVSVTSGNITVGGTVTIQSTVSNLPVIGTIVVSSGTVNVALIAPGSNTVGTMSVIGNVASDSVDSGNPIKIGGQARTSNPTAVAEGDRVNAIFDKLGKQITVGAVRELKAQQYTSIYNSTATTTIVTAGAAGVFNDVYGIVITNRTASANIVTIQDAPSGAVDLIFEVPAADTRGLMLPVDSAIPQDGAATSWVAKCSSAGSIEVTVLYVKNN